jgi:hypothetical protein
MPKESKKVKTVTSATAALKMLWKDGFLKSWKKYAPIVDRLAKADYHFSDPELGMALTRAKYLTRRGKRGGYEYIQKHPFIEDEKK